MGNQADIATPHYDTFQTSSHIAGGILKFNDSAIASVFEPPVCGLCNKII